MDGKERLMALLRDQCGNGQSMNEVNGLPFDEMADFLLYVLENRRSSMVEKKTVLTEYLTEIMGVAKALELTSIICSFYERFTTSNLLSALFASSSLPKSPKPPVNQLRTFSPKSRAIDDHQLQHPHECFFQILGGVSKPAENYTLQNLNFENLIPEDEKGEYWPDDDEAAERQLQRYQQILQKWSEGQPLKTYEIKPHQKICLGHTAVRNLIAEDEVDEQDDDYDDDDDDRSSGYSQDKDLEALHDLEDFVNDSECMASLLLLLIICGFLGAYAQDECQLITERTPKNYIAYETVPGAIVVDGILMDEAWREVEWTDLFIDIQGEKHPIQPWFNTRVKMRWDSKYLYIGAYLQETQVWANQTEHDSVIFLDNDFEVFLDPSGSNHWYKEYEINAINTDWDLELDKPYEDSGNANNSFEFAPDKQNAVYVDGPVNDPSEPNRFWTVELALPLDKIVLHQEHVPIPPRHNDLWRINFSRVEWNVTVVEGNFVKVPNVPENNWVWSSQYKINMHLPERWGYLQFSKESVGQTPIKIDESWTTRYILHEVYYAERTFRSQYGYFTSNLDELSTLGEYIREGKCLAVPLMTVSSDGASYVASVPFFSEEQWHLAHIKQDRYFWIE